MIAAAIQNKKTVFGQKALAAEQKALAEDQIITRLFEERLRLEPLPANKLQLKLIEDVENAYNVKINSKLKQKLETAILTDVNLPAGTKVRDALINTPEFLKAELLEDYRVAFRNALSQQAGESLRQGVAKVLRENYIRVFSKATGKLPFELLDMEVLTTENFDKTMTNSDFCASMRTADRTRQFSAHEIRTIAQEIKLLSGADPKQPFAMGPEGVAGYINDFEKGTALPATVLKEVVSLPMGVAIKDSVLSILSRAATKYLGWGLIFVGAAWQGIAYYLEYTSVLDSAAENNSAKEAFITLLNPENDIPEDVKKATVDTVPGIDTYINPFYTAITLGELAGL